MLDPENLDPVALRAHGIGDLTASDQELVPLLEETGSPAVEAGLEIARRLLAVPLTENGPSSARIGMAMGQVATLGGDYYGAVVNTAARLVNEAEPDEIVVTKAVHDAAADPSLFISLGARSLKGIADPVPLYRLT